MTATVHPFSFRLRPNAKLSRHAVFAGVYNPEAAKEREKEKEMK